MDGLIVKCKPQWKAAFIGTLLVGFLCYFYFLSHHFLTYDSMWNLYSEQDMISSGRQFLKYACGISTYYDLPALNGMLAILYLALTAVVVVEIFHIQSNLCAVLVGAFLVSFPSVISTFAYSFTVDGYMLAILLATLAFWVTERFRFGFVAGALLTGISIGIYQAYFAYLIVLCIIKLLLELIEEDKFNVIVQKAVHFLLMGGLGYLFYAVSLKVMLVYKGAALSGYQGTDKVLSFSFSQIPQGLKAAFDSFYQFAAWGNVFTTTDSMRLAYVLLGLLGGGLFLYRFAEKKRYRRAERILAGLVLLGALPFGLNIICLLSPDTWMHLLIRYAWVLLFVFVLVLADRVELAGRGMRWKRAAVGLAAVFSAVMVFEFGVVANIVAFNMEERYEKTYGLCVRLVDRLEQTEGYETGMEVAILGGFPDEEKFPHTSLTEQDLSGYFGTSGEYCVNSTEKIAAFCAHYLNVTLKTIDSRREVELTESQEFSEMETFPGKDCIKKIDNVWVIKLNG